MIATKYLYANLLSDIYSHILLKKGTTVIKFRSFLVIVESERKKKTKFFLIRHKSINNLHSNFFFLVPAKAFVYFLLNLNTL